MSNKFASLMLKHRNKKVITQDTLAKMVNVSQMMIFSYEADIHTPSFEKALLISFLLEFNLDNCFRTKQGEFSNKAGLIFCGPKIRSRRKALGWNQEKLGDKADTGRFMILKYEKGLHIPNLAVALKLAKVLKCSLYDFAE